LAKNCGEEHVIMSTTHPGDLHRLTTNNRFCRKTYWIQCTDRYITKTWFRILRTQWISFCWKDKHYV